jgi:hypothetical protein
MIYLNYYLLYVILLFIIIKEYCLITIMKSSRVRANIYNRFSLLRDNLWYKMNYYFSCFTKKSHLDEDDIETETFNLE